MTPANWLSGQMQTLILAKQTYRLLRFIISVGRATNMG
jgi:hypothetical protein